MSIKGLSESVRLPRLGKIHLGIKVKNTKGVEYPQKTDYFVLPKDHPDYEKLVDLFTEKPKELRILIPVEDAEQWATQYYKAYNQTYGLVCKGDGEVALRMANSQTGELPQANLPAIHGLRERPCAGTECPDYKAKKCHEVMNLKFLIPEAPGLGVWQIDTGSKNSILNINSCAKMIKLAFGRISLIPLKLTFEPIQVNNPEDGKKQTVYVLNLRTDATLPQLAAQAKEQAKMFMLEAPDFEAMADMQVEQDIDDLWGEKPKVDVTTGEIKEPEQLRKPLAEPPESNYNVIEEEGGEILHAEDPDESVKIDLDWLKETLVKIGWTPKMAMAWITGQLKVPAGSKSLTECLTSLSGEQRNRFIDHISIMRKGIGLSTTLAL